MSDSVRQEGIRGMRRLFPILIVASAIIVALFVTDRSITDWQSEHDALQNLTSAFHLSKVLAGDGAVTIPQGKVVLDNYREPLPVILLALHIFADPALAEVATVDELNTGETLVRLKRHNLVWGFLLLVGLVLTVRRFVGSGVIGTGAAIVGIFVLTTDFLVKTSVIDRFYTEIQAATILVWFTYAMTRAVASRQRRWFAAAGFLAGALALTKGAFFYVAIALPFVLGLICLLPPNRWPGGVAITRFGTMAVCFAVLTGTWIAHNHIRFGSTTITQRGGEIMMMRVYNNRMTEEEARGAIFAWSPWILKDTVGSILGFSDADLSKGGRLQRLNIHGNEAFVKEDWAAEMAGRPEDALTYYTAARAERVKLHRQLREQGYSNPHQVTELRLRKRALREFLADPANHLAKTPLFLWRGLWTRSPPNVVQLVLYLTVVSGFLAVSAAGLLLRWPVVSAYTLPIIGTIMFFALFTQFHPRFPDMLIPAIYVGAVVGGARLWAKAWNVVRSRWSGA